MSGDSPPRPPATPSNLARKDSSVREPSQEKENERPKTRRPLPVPKETSQPQAADAPVPAASFYAASSSSQSHQKSHGSSHTTYVPTPAAPRHEDPPSYREPELVEDASMMPALEPIGGWPNTTVGWPTNETTPWDPTWSTNASARKVDIDDRNEEEELNWCDPEAVSKGGRPGPGLLPALLAQRLHNPDHTLYSVTASQPKSVSSPPTPHSPSAAEIRTAVPHPNAYYCKEHNGWVLLSWLSSAVLPPLRPGFSISERVIRKRRQRTTCMGDDTKWKFNEAHHFHKYEGAVDARTLTTPFKRSEWQTEALRKRHRRKVTLHIEPLVEATSAPGERTEDTESGDLLDLYICCQCSVYCWVSQAIPGVLPVRHIEEFVKDKLDHPAPGKTKEMAVVTGWETVITIIENRLWKGETRILPVTRQKFQSKLGWTTSVRRIFEVLDFSVQPIPQDSQPTSGYPSSVTHEALHPPSIDPATPEGKKTRAKLLRAWVEISSWLSLYHKTRPKEVSDFNPQVLHVNIESATDSITTAIGAHLTMLPQTELPHALVGFEPLEKAWNILGMSPAAYSPELLAFAYYAQCRCDPSHTIDYFSALYEIASTLKNLDGIVPEVLEMLVVEERSRHRFTYEDLEQAKKLLGFGKDNILAVDLEEVDDDFVINAWKSALKRVLREADGSAHRVDLIDSFKIIADTRGSAKLREAWNKDKGSMMSLDTAYSTLDIPKEVDEEMLLTIFNMRVADQPHQGDRMREALKVIAEDRDSTRLIQFLETGRDPGGEVALQTRPDMPRGLNQLGNTCYLNSLLQYFYTIKELRDAVTPLGAKSLELGKFTDDDLKRHRVGGRLVTRREIVRSKKFVNHLADLFRDLEYSETAAVTPTLDLAKLALVTSHDEEEDDQGGAGTDASNDTDATLVEDGPPRTRTSPSPTRERMKSPSILGKRSRNRGRSQDMDVDENITDVEKDDFVIVSKPSSPRPNELKPSSSKRRGKDQGDVVMKDASPKPSNKAPPLPPRKTLERGDSVMMFGRQHDVSECMDNCMFQIETALLDFQNQELAGPQSDKTSVIKRLFYGKIRQRLTPLTEADAKKPRSGSTHEKEDLFSHLHLNVSDEAFDLYDGLSRYFDDVVELEGTKKRMEVTLVDLPPLLQIQLQRAQFDRETQQPYKSQAYVKFGETVCLDRFLDSADRDKRARSKDIQTKLNSARDRIQRLTQGKHAPFAPALGAAADFLADQSIIDIPDSTPIVVDRLRAEQAHVVSQLEHQRQKAAKLKQELEDLWKNSNEAVYQLTSVFIHRGSSPSFGHYFFYSRNLPDHPDEWFKYNDSSVTVVSKDEVFADTTGSTANPYMLVFARKDAEVIQTVHRFEQASA